MWEEDPIKLTMNFCFKNLANVMMVALMMSGYPGFGRFVNWSIRFVSEKHPEWIKANTLREVETDPFIGIIIIPLLHLKYTTLTLCQSLKSIWRRVK